MSGATRYHGRERLPLPPGRTRSARGLCPTARLFPTLRPGANSYQGNPGSPHGYQTRLTYIKQILTTIYVPDMVFRTCKARPACIGDWRKVRVLLQRLNRTLDQPATAVGISIALVVAGGAWPGFVFAHFARGYGVSVERDDPMLLRIAIEETFGSAWRSARVFRLRGFGTSVRPDGEFDSSWSDNGSKAAAFVQAGRRDGSNRWNAGQVEMRGAFLHEILRITK